MNPKDDSGDRDGYTEGMPERTTRPALEHLYRSPGPVLQGCCLMHSVEVEGGRLIEEWFCPEEGVVYRTCIRDRRGWVPYSMSKPVASGNAWKNDPGLDQITIDAE